MTNKVIDYSFLMEKWDYDKNTEFDPKKLSALSHMKVWWKCNNCGYEWQAQIKNRTLSEGRCPKCERKKKSTTHICDVPVVMKYWGDNPDIDPKTETAYSNKVVNWRCPDCGYEWTSTIASKTSLKAECPACMGKVASDDYNAAKKYPELLKYYDADYPDNPALEELRPTSSKIVRWKCPDCGYTWEQPLKQRIRRHKGIHRVANCPVCAGVAVKGVNASLATEYPEIAAEWDADKNGTGPEGIRADSTGRYWWKCSNGHSYSRQPIQRLQDIEEGRISCPVCDGRRAIKETSFAALYPEVAAEWDYTKYNMADGPDHITVDSTTPYHWKCKKGHEYRLDPATIVRRLKIGQTACPYCDNRRTMEGFNSLDITNPELVEEWSSGNKISPGRVQKRYTLPVLWICPVCGGEYEARICDREVGDDSCPYCADKKVLPGYNDLATTNPDLATEYSRNNDREVSRVMKSMKYPALWNCPICGGEYTAKISDREVGDDSCPYCADKKVLPGYNDLATTNPDLAVEYSPNNEREVSRVMKRMKYSALWDCPICGGEYTAKISDREVGDDSCPYCADKKVLPGYNDLATTNPDLAVEYSPNNEREVSRVMKRMKYSALWNCPICGGEYTAKISDREVGDDSCPYCADKKVLPGYNDLVTRYAELIDEWCTIENTMLGLDPHKLFCKSGEIVWWKCPICKNKYYMSVADKTLKSKRNQNACPYCNGRRQQKSHFFHK